jgi:hypothetical protein
MSGEQHQYCPICLVEVEPSRRYPRYVCDNCADRAADEAGRIVTFYNTSLSGGFIAKYADTGEERDSHVCFIDGVECRADEAYFGGIVIQARGDSAPRRG